MTDPKPSTPSAEDGRWNATHNELASREASKEAKAAIPPHGGVHICCCYKEYDRGLAAGRAEDDFFGMYYDTHKKLFSTQAECEDLRAQLTAAQARAEKVEAANVDFQELLRVARLERDEAERERDDYKKNFDHLANVAEDFKQHLYSCKPEISALEFSLKAAQESAEAATRRVEGAIKLLKDAYPIVEAAFWDQHTAGMLPGSGYNQKAQLLAGLKWGWQRSESFTKWSLDVEALTPNEGGRGEGAGPALSAGRCHFVKPLWRNDRGGEP